jgi:hypothetical protein
VHNRSMSMSATGRAARTKPHSRLMRLFAF